MLASLVMRLFLGCEIPEKVKSEIAEVIIPLQKSLKRWESAHDYHLTLLFLGETDEKHLDLLWERLDQFKFETLLIETDEITFFNRRIMFMDIKMNKKLVELKNKVDEQFPEWRRENDKAFHPHITLKRWQRYEYDELFTGLSNISLPRWSFKIEHLCLFKSERDEIGQKYHVIKRSPKFSK